MFDGAPEKRATSLPTEKKAMSALARALHVLIPPALLCCVLIFATPSRGRAQTLTNLTINGSQNATIYGNGTATGTVTLSSPAPAGGTTVCLISNHTNIATVPTSVTVAQGATTANFTVTA